MPRWPAIATVLSMLACYGTLVAIAALGALGVTLSLNEGIWATAIAGFAILAVVTLLAGQKRHGSMAPFLVGAVGGGAVVFTSFVIYSPGIEALGFVLLCCAVWMDWRRARAG